MRSFPQAGPSKIDGEETDREDEARRREEWAEIDRRAAEMWKRLDALGRRLDALVARRRKRRQRSTKVRRKAPGPLFLTRGGRRITRFDVNAALAGLAARANANFPRAEKIRLTLHVLSG